MNNVGGTTLLHPVFNNLEQVIIFCRVKDNPGLKISVSEASDKKSSVFGLGSDIFEMMVSRFQFVVN